MTIRPGLPGLVALAATALLAAAPAIADPPPHAKAWGHPSRQDYRRYADDRRYDGRYYDDHRDYYDRGYDDRHRHDRYCDHEVRRYDARPLYVVRTLPRLHRHVDYRGSRYYYDRDGRWYLPYGAAYAQVAPPVGLVIDSRGIAVVANVPIVRW
ncbi:MAG TPA: hypothetical protein VFX69_02255 [Steroidobacteraceae bacterium]|nr:hypothetical protein [Steroidobacteraceae bacterium]